MSYGGRVPGLETWHRSSSLTTCATLGMSLNLSVAQFLYLENEGSNGGLSRELNELIHIKHLGRASLVAQWLRICLPMQGTRVRALVWEDPTCRGATRPVSHNY